MCFLWIFPQTEHSKQPTQFPPHLEWFSSQLHSFQGEILAPPKSMAKLFVSARRRFMRSFEGQEGCQDDYIHNSCPQYVSQPSIHPLFGGSALGQAVTLAMSQPAPTLPPLPLITPPAPCSSALSPCLVSPSSALPSLWGPPSSPFWCRGAGGTPCSSRCRGVSCHPHPLPSSPSVAVTCTPYQLLKCNLIRCQSFLMEPEPWSLLPQTTHHVDQVVR